MTDEKQSAGTFLCPICGKEGPHGHSNMVINAWRKSQVLENKQAAEGYQGRCGICGETPCNYHGHYPVPEGEV